MCLPLIEAKLWLLCGMPEAQFEVNIQRRTHLFTLEEDLADKLTEIALSMQVPSSELINSWLRQKIMAQ
ncbi:TPA: hypothetical protein EYP66_14385 [Candidatus Poribacteria bacterium]|nr:hypothetical protein [Candidatus Poribacteria bacterium]